MCYFYFYFWASFDVLEDCVSFMQSSMNYAAKEMYFNIDHVLINLIKLMLQTLRFRFYASKLNI